jgi:hypothetical protein
MGADRRPNSASQRSHRRLLRGCGDGLGGRLQRKGAGFAAIQPRDAIVQTAIGKNLYVTRGIEHRRRRNSSCSTSVQRGVHDETAAKR